MKNHRHFFTVTPKVNEKLAKAANLLEYEMPNAVGKFSKDAAALRASAVLSKKDRK